VAHQIHLAVLSSIKLPEVFKVLTACRGIARHFTVSDLAWGRLSEKLKLTGITSPGVMIKDTPTRFAPPP
jgi:hypothetical protein